MLKIYGQKLSKRYGKKMLFRDLDIDISSGESLCVWGPNGSGKSTLLRILAGLLQPNSGSVTYDHEGKKLSPHNAKNLFGVAAPDVIPYDELTPIENLAFLQRMRGAGFDKRAALDLLDTFGILGAADAPVGTMSSGMKQRLRLAAAVLHDPAALLLDEPTSFLDTAGTRRVEKFIREKMTGRIVVIATNNPEERHWCGRIVELGG
jgi:heme exporter protein A